MEQKKILILGAGTGGIVTANELRKKLKDSVKIILIEKEEKNVFQPSLLWVMTGQRKPNQVFRNTQKLNRNGIEVVLGNIEKINPSTISVSVNGNEYKGDFMIASLGAEQIIEHDLDKFGFNFFTLKGATKFYEKLQNLKSGKIAILVSSLPYKCPAAPHEAAMLIESYIRKNGLKNKIEISLFTPEPQPMPITGKEIGQAVKQLIEQKGIKYFPEHQIVSASDKMLTFSNGKTTEYDLLAFIPKHVCPEVIRQTSLVGKSNWIDVNKNTLETDFPNIFAIGDNAIIPLESGRPLPKASVFAHYQAEVVAHNIAEKINNGTNFKQFSGFGKCFLETGEGKAGFAEGNFYASPTPLVKMKNPSAWLHWVKVLFEKFWWFKYF